MFVKVHDICKHVLKNLKQGFLMVQVYVSNLIKGTNAMKTMHENDTLVWRWFAGIVENFLEKHRRNAFIKSAIIFIITEKFTL